MLRGEEIFRAVAEHIGVQHYYPETHHLFPRRRIPPEAIRNSVKMLANGSFHNVLSIRQTGPRGEALSRKRTRH